MKICIITCYKQPDYIRAKTLRQALLANRDVEMIEVKNSHTGVLRYLEVFWKVLRVRFTQNPDIYLLTFRGYEMLLPVRLLSLGKVFIFDEFINLEEWVVHEHKKLGNGFLQRMLHVVYRIMLLSCNYILTDTRSHAELSSKLTNIPLGKYFPLIVGTDEKVFSTDSKKVSRKHEGLDVFYYSNALPLHGLDVILDAMMRVKDLPIRLMLVGGDDKLVRRIDEYNHTGAKIDFKKWVQFEELAQLAHQSDVTIGGPLGGTFQSQYVVTGKTYQFAAASLPVIVGRNNETTEVFTDKKDALLVDQNDPEKLADVLRWCLKNKTELPGIGADARKTYDRKLSQQVLNAQIAEMLAEISKK